MVNDQFLKINLQQCYLLNRELRNLQVLNLHRLWKYQNLSLTKKVILLVMSLQKSRFKFFKSVWKQEWMQKYKCKKIWNFKTIKPISRISYSMQSMKNILNLRPWLIKNNYQQVGKLKGKKAALKKYYYYLEEEIKKRGVLLLEEDLQTIRSWC